MQIAKAAAKAALGEMTGDLTRLARAVSALATRSTPSAANRARSTGRAARPRSARALAQLGEATENETAFQKALACYDRAGLGAEARRRAWWCAPRPPTGAGWRWRGSPSSPATPRCSTPPRPPLRHELAAGPHRNDPVAWAMLQVQLGQVYVTRLALTRRDRGERAAAALAFQSALDVFGEEGLRSLAAIAADGLERLASAKVG